MMALPRFMGNRGFGQVEHGVDIDLEREVPFLLADVLELLEAGLMRRVVDKNIDAAEFADRLVHDRPAMRGVLDVAREQDGFAAGVLDQALALLGVLMLAEIGDQHVGALARERDGHRAADAAIAAGDDRFLAGQAPRAFVRLLAVVGDGIHLPGEARHRLLLLGERRLGIVDHWSYLIARFAGTDLDRRRPDAQTALPRLGSRNPGNVGSPPPTPARGGIEGRPFARDLAGRELDY